MQQLTIFDYLRQQELEEMAEEDMVQQIEAQTGLIFKYNDYLQQYEARRGKTTFTTHFSRYNYEERMGERFISVGWDEKTSGASSPTDSIEEAVNFILYKINKGDEDDHS